MTSHVHRSHRSGWLRAGVLGANDGVLSISSLMLGVAAAHAGSRGVAIAALAGLVGGALSMGAGEYVSVSSQADTERADIETERNALRQNYAAEHAELRDIYIRRGLDRELATRVSEQLMSHDALAAHTRDDIGITEVLAARPLQAARGVVAELRARGHDSAVRQLTGSRWNACRHYRACFAGISRRAWRPGSPSRRRTRPARCRSRTHLGCSGHGRYRRCGRTPRPGRVTGARTPRCSTANPLSTSDRVLGCRTVTT
jgi:VIT1/CCC1 family predicted Fe2+/Mn2+ transporter